MYGACSAKNQISRRIETIFLSLLLVFTFTIGTFLVQPPAQAKNPRSGIETVLMDKAIEILNSINTNNEETDLQNIYALRKRPSVATVDALVMRIGAETVRRLEDVNIEIIETCLNIITSMASEEDIDGLVTQFGAIEPVLSKHPGYQEVLKPLFVGFADKIVNNTPLPYFPEGEEPANLDELVKKDEESEPNEPTEIEFEMSDEEDDAPQKTQQDSKGTAIRDLKLSDEEISKQTGVPLEIVKRSREVFAAIDSGDEATDFKNISELEGDRTPGTGNALLERLAKEISDKNSDQISVRIVRKCLIIVDGQIKLHEVQGMDQFFNMIHEKLNGHPEYHTSIEPMLKEIISRRNMPAGALIKAGDPRVAHLEPPPESGAVDPSMQLVAQTFAMAIAKTLHATVAKMMGEGSDGGDPGGPGKKNKNPKNAEDIKKQTVLDDSENGKSPGQLREEGYARLKTMREYLEASIIGQPEVIDALINLEYRALVLGETHENGVNVKMMGLPGVGKDTSTMGWVDAIHGQNDAWLDHMFDMPQVKTEADITGLVGSKPGYVGSEDLPQLALFMVKHSAGKYLIVVNEDAKSAEKKRYIALNPNWKPGMVIRKIGDFKYFTPDEGVVFINESHNWSKAGKDALKTFLENGTLTLANPGTGTAALPAVTQLHVPMRRVDASNELAGFLSNKRSDGSQIGPPPTFEEILEKWEQIQADKERIKQLATEESAAKSTEGAGDDKAFGTSQETVNRYHDRFILLLRPLSPEDLQKIVKIKLSTIDKLFKKSKIGFDQLNFEFSDELVTFLQAWDFYAMNGARPMTDRVEGIVEQGIIDAIRKEVIKPEQESQIQLSVKKNDDGTYNLVFNIEGQEPFEQPIKATESAKYDRPLSTEEVQDLYSLGDRLQTRLFGLEDVAQRVGDRIALRRKNRKRHVTVENASKKAIVEAFLGLSSTGKTEMSKAIANEVFPGRVENEFWLNIPFKEITSEKQLKHYFLGDKIGSKIEKSRFMEMYDRTGGNFVLNLDEFGEAPGEVQQVFYDLFDEIVYNGAADGKPRPMENVIITLTGNTGQNWYTDIPRQGIPVIEQQAALYEIHRQAMNDPNFIEEELEKSFPAALLRRIGTDDIFFFPPLNYRAIRQLTQHRLMKAIQDLAPNEAGQGWTVNFLDEDNLRATIKMLEIEGFQLFYQGRSLVKFIQTSFADPLETLLDKNGIPAGSEVTLYLKDITDQTQQGRDITPGEVVLGVLTDGKELDLKIRRQVEPDIPTLRDIDQLFTAFHESGHEIVRKVLKGDLESSHFITIRPGIAKIHDKYIRYAGLASSIEKHHPTVTPEVVLAEMAVLTAGGVAESLVSKGARKNSGQSNDMERATDLAYRAILCWGLSDEFGTTTCPTSEPNMLDWVDKTFSENQKKRLEKVRDSWIKKARALARDVLLGNFDLFEEMSVDLGKNGTLEAKGLNEIYAKYSEKMVHPDEITPFLRLKMFSWKRFMARYQHYGRDQEFISGLNLPTKIANSEELLVKQKTKLIKDVELPAEAPLAEPGKYGDVNLKRPNLGELPQRYQYGCSDALTPVHQ